MKKSHDLLLITLLGDILLGYKDAWDGRDMWHAWEISEIHTQFHSDDLKEQTICKLYKYEGHIESKERFAIQRYLLIIGKKQNMQVLSHTFTYFST